MVNPQKENGNTQIANEILEVLVKTNLNGTEFQVVLHIIRKTYGWQKKTDRISFTQLEKATGKTRPAICKAIKSLLVNKVLLVNKTLLGNEYGLNKLYNQWVVNNRLLVNKQKLGSKQMEIKVVNNRLHTKETLTKETIQKKVYKKIPNIDSVKITQKEYDVLIAKYNKTDVEEYIQRLDLYLDNPANKKKYKVHYKVVRVWMLKDKVRVRMTAKEELRQTAKELGIPDNLVSI